MNKDYIAHFRYDGDKLVEHALSDHLNGTAELAKKIGDSVGLPNSSKLVGEMHDAGKFADEFQDYINLAKVDKKASEALRGSIDHATIGGVMVYDEIMSLKDKDPEIQGIIAEILSDVIISHHNPLGFKSYLNAQYQQPFYKRLNKTFKTKEYRRNIEKLFFENVMTKEKFKELCHNAYDELESVLNHLQSHDPLDQIYFLEKLLFSILIDADRSDTMAFMYDKKILLDKNEKFFKTYYQRLLDAIANFPKATDPINIKRSEMSQDCDDFAENGPGIYRLSCPVGGGKTLSSMRFALKSAIRNRQERIIYVIPYTSIIEQNAAVFRKVLNGDAKDITNILEFHSNLSPEVEKEQQSYQPGILDLASDSWDSPIIVTTMVQFLDTIYGAGTTKARRFHNLANSVIIFDEIQNLPVKCTYLFNSVINFLKTFENTTALLCTATQPALQNDEVNTQVGLEINQENPELVKDLDSAFETLKRVKINDAANITGKGADREFDLTDFTYFVEGKIEKFQSCLVICNTKRAAAQLFDSLQNDGVENVYHLSTSMCPAHRKSTLDEIENRLKNNLPTICVSTQLIEAGVDISFPCVIRSLAGLDSIAQASGRCNRNGELEVGDLSIVKLDKSLEDLSKLDEIAGAQANAITVLTKMKKQNASVDELLKPKWIKEYFRQASLAFENYVAESDPRAYQTGKEGPLYYKLSGRKDYLDYYDVKRELPKGRLFSDNETISKCFQTIDAPTQGIIVPYGDGEEIVNLLNSDEKLNDRDFSDLLHKAQQFSVNVYDLQFWLKNDVVKPVRDGQIYVVLDPAYYDPKKGLMPERGKFASLIC